MELTSQRCERGILFTGHMAHAILNGTKTQTRRAVLMPRRRDSFVLIDRGNGWWPYQSDDGESELCNDGMEHPYTCPFGQPGDRLWVRETWQHANHPFGPYTANTPVFYRADYLSDSHGPDGEKSPEGRYRYWKPSLHMPRTASRITLEVLGVRVERLQDGDGETAFESRYLAEGINRIHHGRGEYCYSAFRNEPHPKNWCDPADAFRELWEATGGTWNANPWVWCVDFRVLSTTASEEASDV